MKDVVKMVVKWEKCVSRLYASVDRRALDPDSVGV